MASNDAIYSRLGMVEGTLKTFIEELRDQRERDERAQATMENDIRDNRTNIQKVATRETWMMGVASGLGTAGGLIGTLLGAVVHSYRQTPQL